MSKCVACRFQVEQDFLTQLFEKYVPSCIDMIIEGIVDGRQGERLKTIVPLTNLNMVICCLIIFT